jgi:hypothetical protein
VVELLNGERSRFLRSAAHDETVSSFGRNDDSFVLAKVKGKMRALRGAQNDNKDLGEEIRLPETFMIGSCTS